jgi:chaperonin GroES
VSTFVPLNGRVAVKRDGLQEKQVGGIIIPDFAQDAPQFATVIAVAENGRDEAEHKALGYVKVGDRVVLGKYAGSEVQAEGGSFTVLNVLDILGVIR